MSAQTAEIENRLAANADENVITLEDGMQVELVALKTRQAFALFRIVLKGTYQGSALLADIARDGGACSDAASEGPALKLARTVRPIL